MRTNPLMPKVEGNIYDMYSQNLGMAAAGHEIPDINNNGTDVNTNINIHVSRLRMKIDVVIAKKIHAAK